MPLTRQAHAFLEAVAAVRSPGWEELTPQQGPATFNRFDGFFGEGPQLDQVEDFSLPGNVKIRLYRQASRKPQPAIVSFSRRRFYTGESPNI